MSYKYLKNENSFQNYKNFLEIQYQKYRSIYTLYKKSIEVKKSFNDGDENNNNYHIENNIIKESKKLLQYLKLESLILLLSRLNDKELIVDNENIEDVTINLFDVLKYENENAFKNQDVKREFYNNLEQVLNFFLDKTEEAEFNYEIFDEDSFIEIVEDELKYFNEYDNKYYKEFDGYIKSKEKLNLLNYIYLLCKIVDVDKNDKIIYFDKPVDNYISVLDNFFSTNHKWDNTDSYDGCPKLINLRHLFYHKGKKSRIKLSFFDDRDWLTYNGIIQVTKYLDNEIINFIDGFDKYLIEYFDTSLEKALEEKSRRRQ